MDPSLALNREAGAGMAAMSNNTSESPGSLEHMGKRAKNFQLLMTRRVKKILLIASRYDYFTFQGNTAEPEGLFLMLGLLQRTASCRNRCSTRRPSLCAPHSPESGCAGTLNLT